MLSEFNDFPQSPGTNSYESCLRAIESCDYFILLIGRRTGGWYDREQKISITRAEYRHAYELSDRGQLQLLTMVRRDLWDIREDRRALSRMIRNGDLSDWDLPASEISEITNHGSRFVNDAEATFAFLREVGRVDQMIAADAGQGPRPAANWIYQFSTFRDVIDALRTVLDLSGGLRRKAVRANLLHELEELVSKLLTPSGSSIRPVTHWSRPSRSQVQGGFGDSSSYSGKQLSWLAIFILCHANVGMRIQLAALRDAIQSGVFLEADLETGRLIVGPLQASLYQLNEQVERFSAFSVTDLFSIGQKLAANQAYKSRREDTFHVRNDELVVPFAVHDAIENVLTLAGTVYRTLVRDDGNVEQVELRPSSPFVTEAERVSEERVTRSQTRAWLMMPAE